MDKNRQVVWSSFADQDFAEILLYLSHKWGFKVVEQFINHTENVVQQIVSNPYMFPVVKSSIQVRKAVLSSHNSLYYRVSDCRIEILRIYDTRQHPGKLKFEG